MPPFSVARSALRAAAAVLVLTGLLSACSEYHGPITNAPEGYHQIGTPAGA